MKPTKKQLESIKEIEKKVSEVCDTKKTVEVTRNDDGVIINKETGEMIYENIGLRAYLSPQTPRNQWITNEENDYVLRVVEPTGENSSRVLINNPAYAAYEELNEEEQEKIDEPETTITLEIIYERIPRKHWAFMD